MSSVIYRPFDLSTPLFRNETFGGIRDDVVPHTSEEAGVRRGMPGRNFRHRMSSAWIVSCLLSTGLS